MFRLRTMLAVLALYFAAGADGAAAQESTAGRPAEIVLTGVVRDGASRPVRGARVSVVEAHTIAWTDGSGGYRLRLASDGVPAGGLTLRVEADGYRPAESRVEAGPGRTRHDVVLTAEAVPLDAITVSAPPGDARRRATTARVEAIDAAAVVASASVATLEELIQARVPGVSVFQASGTPGTAAQVRIRGVHGIADDGAPAVYVDGVRVDGAPRALIDVGGPVVGGLTGLSPEDIESVEVLRGPASTLWLGPDAAGGALLVTTTRAPFGGRRFSQRIVLERGPVEPGSELPANWVRCGDRPTGVCATEPPDALLSDSPLERSGLLDIGAATAVHWSGRASGNGYGAYGSLGWTRDEGVLPNSGMDRRGGRIGLRIRPAESVELDVGLGTDRVEAGLPSSGWQAAGYLFHAMTGEPQTVGSPPDGWALVSGDSLTLYRTEVASRRYQPTLRVSHRALPWLSHRLIAGADFARDEAWQVDSLSRAAFGESYAVEAEREAERYTFDYSARLHGRTGEAGRHALELLVGVQVMRDHEEGSARSGKEIAPGVIDSVFASESGYWRTREMDAVVLDGRYGYRDRLFWEAGVRLDRINGGDSELDRLSSYRFGAAYVVYDGATRRAPIPGVGAVRLHGAVGAAERRPSLPLAMLISPGSGFGSPPVEGRNERLSEVEVGLEVGALDDRIGFALTAFERKTRDMAVFPASGGARVLSWGAVGNRGLEARLTAAVLRRRDVAWALSLGVTRLDNEVTDLDYPWRPATGEFSRVGVGFPAGAMFTHRILEVDTVAGVAMVSDTVELVGRIVPEWEGALDTQIALWRRLRVHALFDWRAGFHVYNATELIRSRMYRTSERWARRDELSESERLRSFGPYADSNGNTSFGYFGAADDYIQNGRFLRLRELAATLELPRAWAARVGASGASFTLAGRNVALWSAYRGPDPEVLTSVNALERSDLFTLPQTARWVGRLTVQF